MITFAQPGQAQQPPELPGTPIGIQTTFKESATQATDSLIQSLINQTNLDTLIRTVNILSGEDSVTINDSTYFFLSRNAAHPHNNLAADFIFQTLKCFGLPTYNQTYNSTGRNVYSIKAGTVLSGKKSSMEKQFCYPPSKVRKCSLETCRRAKPRSKVA
jgi:hypothetical protein